MRHWHPPSLKFAFWQKGENRMRANISSIICLYSIKEVHININLDVIFIESEMVDPPLIYLFEDDHQTSDSAALVYQLYRNEKIQWVQVALG